MHNRPILSALVAEGVRFLVIGGVAASVQGVPVTTFDLDLVHDRERENCRRLRTVLASLGAHYRQHRNKRIEPRSEDLELPGHHLLATDHGPLDLLGALTDGRGYAELEPRSLPLDFGDGLVARVLELEALVEIKETLGREKDRAVLPLYRRTLEERRRKT